MKTIFQAGDQKRYEHTVMPNDAATFASGEVHPVYATFAIARDAEWVCRLFVLEMKEADEEGIGTFVNVKHHSPALIGAKVQFEATVISFIKNEIICGFEAKIGERIIATGQTGQKILKRDKLNKLFSSLVK